MDINFPPVQEDFFSRVNDHDKQAAVRWIDTIFSQLESEKDIDAFSISWAEANEDVKLAALYLADSKAPMTLDWATPQTPAKKFSSYQRSLIVRALARLGHGCSITCGRLIATKQVLESMSDANREAAQC
ncbi:hypothetical protein HBA55_34755 [Pseudomaricurvus alkylphenolicus]|uniref:hypothetical protein n=1 Tax=Pseudomaricurvus alkylphenolicus TaxID=1306991 RepID=UPI001422CEB2|nr:hypothetical protein [Pseudomaricurvus alkylphenolicus]NIB44793.1 hypothetical protein [Pseudomaricurvus alkylphenolicus]